MKTVTSVSGGQSSAYIAANYPSDYLVFALVTTDDPKCKHPDKRARQKVSDLIGREFIGTLEDDTIIYTMLELEQWLQQEIHWVAGETFDKVAQSGGLLPNKLHRFCTVLEQVKSAERHECLNDATPMGFWNSRI